MARSVVFCAGLRAAACERLRVDGAVDAWGHPAAEAAQEPAPGPVVLGWGVMV